MKAKEIRSMTVDEIENKLVELRDKLFKQKIQKSLGQADNPYKIRHTRRDIARMETILTEKRSSDGSKDTKQ
jgi:large subunit ribosomal protein L29